MKIHIRIVRIIAYVFFLALTIFLFGYFRAFFFLMLFVIETLLAAADIASIAFLVDRISFKITAPVMMTHKDDPAPIIFTIYNPTFIPSFELCAQMESANTFYGTDGTTRIALPVRARGETVRRFPLSFTLLGSYDFSVAYVTVRDLLGFADVRKEAAQDAGITVFPSQDDAEDFDPDEHTAGMTEADETDRKGNDFSDVSEIREYVPGDRPRDIHWKLSAKKDELMVKQRSAMSDEQLIVVVEFTEIYADNDRVMEETYAVCRELVRSGVNTRLMWWNAMEEEFHQKRLSSMENVDEAFVEIFSGKAAPAGEEMQYLMRSVHPEIRAFLLIHYTENGAEETVVNES